VTLLQRYVAVEVDDAWVSPIPLTSPMTSASTFLHTGS
jgi:hypothetical protein